MSHFTTLHHALNYADCREKYVEAGLIPDGVLKHLISDAATMQIIRWNKGGFGMAAHNYDGNTASSIQSLFLNICVV